jgi:hypothetical protein
VEQVDQEPLAEVLGEDVAASEFGAAAEDGGKRFGTKREFARQAGPGALGLRQLLPAFLEGEVAAEPGSPPAGAAGWRVAACA